jgi:hypothetical protein
MSTATESDGKFSIKVSFLKLSRENIKLISLQEQAEVFNFVFIFLI